MQITVNEALKLKNEISAAVNQLQHSLTYGRSVEYGVRIIDGEQVDQNTQYTFAKAYSRLVTLFAYSNEINTTLARFNVESGVAERVRSRKNLEVQLVLLENAVGRSRPENSRNTEYVSGVGKVVRTVDFVPHQSVEELREVAQGIRQQIREIDSQIFTINAQAIELSFSYEDLDALMVREADIF